MCTGIFAIQLFYMLKGKLINNLKNAAVIIIIVIGIIIPVTPGGGNLI